MIDTSLAISAPTVLSEANPKPLDLLQARARVQQAEGLREAFQQAKTENWDASRLARHISEVAEVPQEASKYLADEYLQLGEGIFLVSEETGKISGIIREEDIYLPAPVPREGSDTLAQPTPRLRPDLEAAIVLQGYETAREKKILEALVARGHQTDLLREMGDPSLLVATRLGRRSIVEDLAGFDPRDLLEACGGTSAAFLKCFELVTEPPPIVEGLSHLEGVVYSKSVMGVQDPTTLNLRHNRVATLRGALVQGWVREIAGALSLGENLVPPPLDVRDMGTFNGIWVAAPHLVRPIRESHPNLSVLPVACRTYCVSKPAGYIHIRVPPELKALSQEAFGRWEASSYLNYEVWYDPKSFRYFQITGIDETPQVLLVDMPR